MDLAVSYDILCSIWAKSLDGVVIRTYFNHTNANASPARFHPTFVTASPVFPMREKSQIVFRQLIGGVGSKPSTSFSKTYEKIIVLACSTDQPRIGFVSKRESFEADK